MSDTHPHDQEAPEVALARHLDAICRRFEADWRVGRIPAISDFLGEIAEEGQGTLRAELEALENELRQADEAATVAHASLPTSPIPGIARPPVHEDATIAPRDDATVDLGPPGSTQTEASSPMHVRYFGDYEIIREIARGGMGVVFQATQVSLNRPVALKMILAGQLANDTDVKRFYTEAEAAANLDHPGIVPIYEVGQHQGQHYFSMGFVEGQSLSQRLAEGPLPPGYAAELMKKVAESIEYAHQHGVIHRDLKPANILLDSKGNPRVTDFGLAKKREVDSGLTGSGQIMGTPSYMPPEQAGGGRGEVGPAADVYALGATLYCLITGRPPFQAATPMDTVIQVISDEPVPPRRLNPAVDRDIDTICLRCLEKEPTKRYASAAALAEELARFLAGEPILARPVGRAERAWRWCRRNPVVAGLTAALMLVFLAGFAGVAWKWQAAEREKHIARAAEQQEAAQRQIAAEQADLATREADRSRRLLYASDMSLAYQAWEAADTGRARDLLEEQRPQPGQKDLRGFEWRYLWSLSQDGSRQTLRGHTSWFSQVNVVAGASVTVAFAPDGKTLATCEWDNSVRIWDVASRPRVKVLAGGIPTSVAFAPDGKTLAIAELSGQAVRLWDVAAHCERATLSHPTWVWSVAFSPDGKLLATGCEDRTVRIWDVARRQVVGILRGHISSPWRVVFSPDGRTLASAGLSKSVDNSVRLWDVAAGRLIAALQGHTKWVTALSFSPDGKLLASASADSTVRLWDSATTQAVKTLREPGTVLNSVAFAPDGKTLATGGGDGTVRVWDAMKTEVVALLRGHTAPVTAVAFAPDGRSLVSASRDGTVKVWDAASQQSPNTLSGHQSFLTSLAVSPDGKTLAVSDADEHDHTVKLWDLASRRPVAILKGHKEVVMCVTFAADGQTLASGSMDKTVRLWDVARKEQLAEFQHEGYVACAEFSPDGKLLAAATLFGEPGRVWDLTTRREVAQLNSASRIQFTPDGKLLAASSGNTVWLWDTGTWRNVAVLRTQTAEVLGLAFAPDGRTLAVGDAAGTIRLWDVAQKEQVASRRGHASEVSAVAFAPDGRRLATIGGDSTVKLWDAALLREVASLMCRDTLIKCLAFAPDGNTLATGGSDGTVRLWQAPAWSAGLREPADAPIVAPVETTGLFSLQLFGAAGATRTAEGNVQRVDVTAVDGTDWHAHLYQTFFELPEGTTYKVRFRARADAPRNLRLNAQIVEPDWHLIGLNERVPLSDHWRAYEFEFQAKNVAKLNSIAFNVGERRGTVWIADFTLTKAAK